MKLNRLIAKLGIASRRKANELIKQKKVLVNEQVVENFTLLLKEKDKITVDGENFNSKLGSLKFNLAKKKITFFYTPINDLYVLLNKPTGYVTSASDPQNRPTVFDLLPKKFQSQVHYMGRLDKETSGVLLFTNNGELTKRITHPSYKVSKEYLLQLKFPFKAGDKTKIIRGINLNNQVIKVDEVKYGDSRKNLLVKIHSGQNRILRKIFDQLHYPILKLSRVNFAGITTQGLPLGEWRFLKEAEIIKLKEK